MHLLKKQETFLFRHRFFLSFFLYLFCYHILIVNRLSVWRISDLCYSLYCVDFSFGFATKLLPGAVFRFLFGSHASRTTANFFAVAMVLLVFCGVSVLLERFMLRMPSAHRSGALFLVLFFLSGAYTFAIYTRWVGMLDTAWLLIAILFFVFLEHRLLRFFIPLLYVLSLMIHFSSLVFFLTVFSIVLLHRISVSSEPRDRRALWIVFALSLCCTAVVFSFFLLNEMRLVCPIDEFREKLLANGTDFHTYFDYAFFRMWSGRYFIPEEVNAMPPSFLKFLSLFAAQVKLVYDIFAQDQVRSLTMTLGGTAAVLPLVWFVLGFHFRRLLQGENGLKRFCAFLMLVQFPFVYVLGLLFAISVDMTRYLTHACFGMFLCLFAVLYHEEAGRMQFFARLEAIKESSPVRLYFFVYASFALMPSL